MPMSEPRKPSSTIRIRKTTNNVRPLSFISVLLVILFRPFLACYSSAGLPTYIRPGNVSRNSLIHNKYISISLRYTKNRLYILVNLERVCTLSLGTIYPPLYTLHPKRARNYLLPYINTL